jgi:hypothetical protein
MAKRVIDVEAIVNRAQPSDVKESQSSSRTDT